LICFPDLSDTCREDQQKGTGKGAEHKHSACSHLKKQEKHET